jgi:leucyl/phenylalanyl-tRNA---protein transferase
LRVDVAAAPRPLPPPAWVFPDPASADSDGVVGIGADLAPETLAHAYRNGIFPWPHAGSPLPWFSPDPRGVITTETIRVSRSLGQRMRRSGWRTTVDRAFRAVIANCADRPAGEGTWITRAMARAYTRLHELGWAHSVEVWDGAALVGGLYGVQVGGCFTGESMFHRETDASKVALVDLLDRLDEAGGSFIDVQIRTPHLGSLGAVDEPRGVYLGRLTAVRDDDVRLSTGARPAARLARWRAANGGHT